MESYNNDLVTYMNGLEKIAGKYDVMEHLPSLKYRLGFRDRTDCVDSGGKGEWVNSEWEVFRAYSFSKNSEVYLSYSDCDRLFVSGSLRAIMKRVCKGGG